MCGPTTGAPPFTQGFGSHLGAFIIESHSIDDGSIRNGAENSRRWVARLRVPRDGSQFGEPESQSSPGRQSFRVFVHARGQANRVGKIQPEYSYGQARRAKPGLQRLTCPLAFSRPAQTA